MTWVPLGANLFSQDQWLLPPNEMIKRDVVLTSRTRCSSSDGVNQVTKSKVDV